MKTLAIIFFMIVLYILYKNLEYFFLYQNKIEKNLKKQSEEEEEEEIQYTCCGNEITGEVEDVGLCPTCLEHI
mgnify:CR=1 FL=1